MFIRCRFILGIREGFIRGGRGVSSSRRGKHGYLAHATAHKNKVKRKAKKRRKKKTEDVDALVIPPISGILTLARLGTLASWWEKMN